MDKLMGVFQATKIAFLFSLIPCSGIIYISLPCGERKFIAYACL